MKTALRYLFVLLLTIAMAGTSYAQRWKLLRYELVGGIGSTNIFGDIGGAATRANLLGIKDLRFGATRPNLTLGARYRWKENQSFRLNLIYGMASENDKNAVNEKRGFISNSQLFEQSLQYEYYFIPEDKKLHSGAIFSRRGMMNNYAKFAFYGFGGLGGLLYMPKVTYSLLPPPAQNVRGTGYTGVMMLGIGLKYIYSNKLVFGAELGGRYALSDGVDGYTSPFSKSNDIYYFATLSIGFRLKTDRFGYPVFLSNMFPSLRR